MPCSRCGGPHSTEDCPLSRYKPRKKYAELELAGTIRDLQARKDLQLVTDSQDVKRIIEDLNIDPKEDFGGFFVKVEGGEYKEVYGFTGSVPELHKNIYYVRPVEHSSSPVTVEEMRRALHTMEGRIGYMLPESRETKMFQSAMYAAKTTMKDATERRIFVQDFAASLNRAGLLTNENVDDFTKFGYVYMEAKGSEHSSNSFHVKYIDLTTGKKEEKTISDREQYDLYKLQREGKISIIDIHKGSD